MWKKNVKTEAKFVKDKICVTPKAFGHQCNNWLPYNM